MISSRPGGRGRARIRDLAILALAFLPGFSCITVSPHRLTPTVNHEDPLYRDVRRADVLGLVPTSSLSQGVVREVDLARALADSQQERELEVVSGPDDPPPPPDDDWFEGVLERYDAAIEDVWEPEYQATHLQPFERPRLRLIAVDEHVRFENERGRDFSHGLNLFITDRASLRLFDHFLVTAQPEFSLLENGRSQRVDRSEALNVRMQELTAAARFGPVEWTVGRTPLWWGPGRHGSLLLSTNSRPFDLIKVGSAGPQLLPGFLEVLGFVQAEVFLTRLESARSVRRPYLAGMRVSSRLFPWLELGANRTAQFGGGDRSVTRSTLWQVATASTENDDDDPGNQLGSIDARIILSWPVQPVELYTEIGGEDEAGGFFSKRAYLAGLYLPRLGPLDWIELVAEWTTTEVSGEPRLWYTNRNYPDGYTHHERIIGHHVGSDGMDIFLELRLHPVDDWTVLLSYDFEEHFIQDPVTETLHQVRLGVETRAWERLHVGARVGVDLWKNFDQNRGQDERGHFLELSAFWRF